MTSDPCGLNGWSVSQCECGRMTLRLGQVTIELTIDEFSHLHRLLGRAMTEFEIQPSTEPVFNPRATTH